MSTDATTALPQNTHHLSDDPVVLQQMIRELLTTVAGLRSTIDKQQAHIHYLVRMTFGRRSERVEGPTLFDGVAVPEPEPAPAPPPEPQADDAVVVKRRGHGRRQRPIDVPREREVLDVTAAEKVCPCCGEPRVCIGEDVSERVDYRPACLFRRVIARPTYICRHCEQKGNDIQAVQAPLPPEPIPRCSVGAGLLAHVIVSKYTDHRVQGEAVYEMRVGLSWPGCRIRPQTTGVLLWSRAMVVSDSGKGAT